MNLRDLPAGGVPTRWLLCFSHEGSGGWIDAVTFGRFKHVSAFGAVPGLDDVWLFYDVRRGQTVLGAASGNLARRTIEAWTRGCTVVAIDRFGEAPTIWSRLGFWCAPAVRHLIGLRCVAVRPQSLFRAALAHGGKVISEGHPASHARPVATDGGAAGAAAADCCPAETGAG